MVEPEQNQLMERYKVQDSIEDVLAILDSAQIQPDLMPERNLVQLTNRIPIAHLAIERGMKGLIKMAGGGQEETHSLGKLYDILKEVEIDSAEFLATAFEDAVSFYGYNPKRSGFEQFQSIDEYFSRVGGKKAFDALRYWAIGDPGTGETAIKFISPPIHREILCALRSLLIERPETASERVEGEVRRAMWRTADLSYDPNDRDAEELVDWYENWLTIEHESFCDALAEAVSKNFDIKDGNELIARVLKLAWEDLIQSKDPAVRYFIHKLTYLREGSQPQDPNAIPEVEWIREDLYAKIDSPSGTCLGIVNKQADGAWGITPIEDGIVGVKAVAWKLKDAKNFLVNRLTSRVSVTVDGPQQTLRIIGNGHSFGGMIWSRSREVTYNLMNRARAYELEFWDGNHGLVEGSQVSLVTLTEGDSKYATFLEGSVTKVDTQKVTIEGNDWIGIAIQDDEP